jgi:hypothetical protein
MRLSLEQMHKHPVTTGLMKDGMAAVIISI